MKQHEAELLENLKPDGTRHLCTGERWAVGDGSQNVNRISNLCDVGWRAARIASELDALPSFLGRPCYRNVVAASYYLKLGTKVSGRFPETAFVIRAKQLIDTPGMAALLRGCLFAADASPDNVAEVFGIKAEVIRAFNDLFFNVLDRKDDMNYRLQIAFPFSGGAAGLAQAMAGTEVAEPLLEIGFRGSLDDVLVAGKMKSVDSTPSLVAGEVQRRALAATAGWISEGKGKSTPSPLVLLGLDIARKVETLGSDDAAGSFGIGGILSRQLESDAVAVRDSIQTESTGGDQ